MSSEIKQSSGIAHAALAAIGLLILSACQTPTVGESQVEMTWSEHNTMYDVLNDVRKEARRQHVETNDLFVDDIVDMLVSRDSEIQSILNEPQWQAYDEGERDYYARKIFRSVRESPIGAVSRGPYAGTGINSGASTPAIRGGPDVN